ncbi:hypothetical protein CJF30_00005020 [Rutstroemia sp. NJR-2017a BBW]|nr:hypothetical protein CJF30_00005020 [Rutstroemia sp. NJR-2017a BBW]
MNGSPPNTDADLDEVHRRNSIDEISDDDEVDFEEEEPVVFEAASAQATFSNKSASPVKEGFEEVDLHGVERSSLERKSLEQAPIVMKDEEMEKPAQIPGLDLEREVEVEKVEVDEKEAQKEEHVEKVNEQEVAEKELERPKIEEQDSFNKVVIPGGWN